MAGVELEAIVSPAFRSSRSGRSASKVDDGNARRRIVIVVPAVDVARKLRKLLDQRDCRAVDDPAPGQELVFGLLFKVNRDILTGGVPEGRKVDEAYMCWVTQIVRE